SLQSQIRDILSSHRISQFTFRLQERKERRVISQILHINIPTPIGHLEGILKPEEQGVIPEYVAIVCHPHPLGGGTMHNKVVFKVAQTLKALGVPARTFNGDTLQGCHKPKLFIHGTEDELAPYDLTVKWFEQVPAPKRLVAVQGADHFFPGHLEEVQAIITDFIQTL